MVKSKLFFILVCAIILVVSPSKIHAQEEINSFELNMTVQKDGVILNEEVIDYNFGTNERRGIFRYIPISEKIEELYLISKITPQQVLRDEKKEKFTTNYETDQIYLKIGDPDIRISGPHRYKIIYKVSNQIRNYDTHDEVYWNVTGNGWEVPMESVKATIQTDFPVNITRVKCFTGASGSTEQNCSASIEGEKAIFLTQNLSSNEGLTIVAAFPPNTFPKSVYSKDPPGALTQFQKILIGIGLIFYYLILPGIILFWYLKKKRKNRFGPVSVNFDIPKDAQNSRIPPAEAGAIDNSKLDRDDVIATIFDFAIRKLIKIEQIPQSKVLGIIPLSGKDYKLKKISDKTADFTQYETYLWNRLFRDGDEVELSSLKTDFYKTFANMEQSLFASLKRRGLYIKNPKTQRGGLQFGGVAGILTGNIFLGILLLYLSSKLNGRTQLGDQKDWQVDGLKVFLKNMKRHHKWQAENLYTVEDYIPYAIALGYINEFMEQLKVVDPNYKPTWYSGGNFYGSYPAFYSSMNSSVTTASPSSSSSGFSSGGSSGGGGGGGGGGSW